MSSRDDSTRSDAEPDAGSEPKSPDLDSAGVYLDISPEDFGIVIRPRPRSARADSERAPSGSSEGHVPKEG